MTQPARFLALDVFRGMTVCFMIIVNSPGNGKVSFAPLKHALWHGFTATDLVFPSFLFAVGNAMAFAMHKYELQGDAAFWKKTIKRTLIIFLLGFLLYWFPFVEYVNDQWIMKPLAETRILGVLQRIALCYFAASIILHYGSEKKALWFSALALIGYWILMLVFGDSGDPYSVVGNAVRKLDVIILGEQHMHQKEEVAFDPEGLLSTLPAIVNVVLGYLAGLLIRRIGNNYETVAKLSIAGALMVVAALTWDMTFPINKKLWTSSFTLLTVGMDFLLLAALIYFIEIVNFKRGSYFFVVFGKNPLFIYLLSEILLIVLYMIPVGSASLPQWMYADIFGSFASPANASLLFAIFFMLVNWFAGYILDKKHIYIKV